VRTGQGLRLTERLGAKTLLLGGVMIVTLSLFVAGEQDPDFWWHLRTGRWMLDNGRLPSVDLYTFTVPTHIWTDHEYLTEILMWLVYQATGVIGLSLAFGLLTWAGFWIMYRQVRRQPWVIAGIGLAIGATAGSPIWGPRAQMITFFLTCLELYWLQAYLAGRSRAIQLFPLVMVLWANLHGGWVIGFVWLGVALGAELLAWAWDRANPAHRKHVRFLAIRYEACGRTGSHDVTLAIVSPLTRKNSGSFSSSRRTLRTPPPVPRISGSNENSNRARPA